jgi:DNA polymerase-3 subunit epsilon
MAFDEMIMGSELLRNGMQNSLSDKIKICTMKQTTAFCRLSGEYGYKWPKLSELHYKLFRTGFADAHNASADISITAKCFWELRRIGRI